MDMSIYKKYFDTTAKISGDAVKYFNDNEVLVYAQAFKNVNWDEYTAIFDASLPREARQMMPIIVNYLKKFDGTVSVGVGVKNGMQSFNVIDRSGLAALTEVEMTIVGETKDGEAERLMNEIKTALGAYGMAFTNTGSGLEISVPMVGVTVFGEVKDNLLIFSTHKIEENTNVTVDKVAFDNYSACLALVLNKDNKLFSDLGITNNASAVISGDATTSEGALVLTLDGDGTTGIIGNALKLGFQLGETFGNK